MRKLMPLALLLLAACAAPTAETTGAAEDAIDSTDDGISGASPSGGYGAPSYGGLDLAGGPTGDTWTPYEPEPLADQQAEERARADREKAARARATCYNGCRVQAITSRAKCPPREGYANCAASVNEAEAQCHWRCNYAYDHAVGRD